MKAYKPGQHVRNSIYGVGTILSSNEERTAIDFLEHGQKLFVTSIVQLEPATAEEAKPAPSKRRTRATRARAVGGARKRSRLVKVSAR